MHLKHEDRIREQDVRGSQAAAVTIMMPSDEAALTDDAEPAAVVTSRASRPISEMLPGTTRKLQVTNLITELIWDANLPYSFTKHEAQLYHRWWATMWTRGPGA